MPRRVAARALLARRTGRGAKTQFAPMSSMDASDSLHPDRLEPAVDSLDPATARITSVDDALPSWHLAPFWAAVALLALVLMLAVMVWPLRGRIENSRVLRQFAAVRRCSVSSDPSIVR